MNLLTVRPHHWVTWQEAPAGPASMAISRNPWRTATSSRKAPRLGGIMKIAMLLPAVAAVVVYGAAPSLASTPARAGQQPATPNSCIEANNGDFNACNVGNSGRGDLPYSPIATPNSCIERNHGDFNACNVGNSGRGDLPYRPTSR
jgi:hypothetical protein